MTRATYGAEEVAELLGVAPWTLYAQVRQASLPPELAPLRVGRRLLWPRSKVDAALGLVTTTTEG